MSKRALVGQLDRSSNAAVEGRVERLGMVGQIVRPGDAAHDHERPVDPIRTASAPNRGESSNRASESIAGAGQVDRRMIPVSTGSIHATSG